MCTFWTQRAWRGVIAGTIWKIASSRLVEVFTSTWGQLESSHRNDHSTLENVLASTMSTLFCSSSPLVLLPILFVHVSHLGLVKTLQVPAKTLGLP